MSRVQCLSEIFRASGGFASTLHDMKWLSLIFLAVLPSCMWLPRSVPEPVKTLTAGNAKGEELIVFLPGRWSRVEEFQQEGFFKIAEKRWPKARLVAADLHLGYYKNRSMARRLHEDVILPAKRSGVKTVRVVGISMGGLGALIYDQEYPRQIDEMILLSPFLGEEKVLQEIQAAGSLKNWQPNAVVEKDFSRKLWLGLRGNWTEKTNQPKVSLGCGNEDRLAESNRLFAKEFLKPSQQKWISGGHDWATWRALFEK
jgi:pimeloyl-ACP methyl ester carboxylesterase